MEQPTNEEVINDVKEFFSRFGTPKERVIAVDPRVHAVMKKREELRAMNERLRPRWYGIIRDVQEALGVQGI